jgi:TPR repeat protein
MKKLKLLASGFGVVAFLFCHLPAHAGWSAADDEANRQRMMNSMRQQDAYNDRKSFERSMQQNAYQSSGSSSSSSYGSSGSSGGYSGPVNPTQPIEQGPQSVVASYTFVVYKRETEAQTIERIRKEAEGGEMLSQFNLARIYYTGYGVARSDAEARKWFKAAAAQGHVPSQAQYGMMAVNAQGGPADHAGGMASLKQASDAGDSYAMALFGFFTLQDHMLEEQPQLDDTIRLLEVAADRGEVIAQATLGRIVYYLGVGTPVNAEKAIKYLRLAAAQGDPGAMDDLGELYLGGTNGVTQDTTEGLRLVKASADSGFTRAQYIYGLLLLQGQMTAKNEAEGLTYMRKAAENGHAEAQFLYADCLYFGTGTAKNIREAALWYQKAARQGHVQSIEILKEPEIVAALQQT